MIKYPNTYRITISDELKEKLLRDLKEIKQEQEKEKEYVPF